MAIFEEQIYEPFVARGLGNSGLASRQVMASNLPDLRAALAQSESTRRSLKLAHLYSLARQRPAPRAFTGVGRAGGGNQPIVLGRVGGSTGAGWGQPTALAYAIPDGKGGYQVRTDIVSTAQGNARESLNKIDALRSLGLNIPINISNLPDLTKAGNITGMFALGQNVNASGIDLAAALSNVSGINNVLKNISLGTTFSGGGGGRGVPFSFFPSASDRAWEATQIKKQADSAAAAARMRDTVYPKEREVLQSWKKRGALK